MFHAKIKHMGAGHSLSLQFAEPIPPDHQTTLLCSLEESEAVGRFGHRADGAQIACLISPSKGLVAIEMAPGATIDSITAATTAAAQALKLEVTIEIVEVSRTEVIAEITAGVEMLRRHGTMPSA